MSKHRRVFEAAYGPIPKGYQIHHKTPRYAGGTDALENLELLTRSAHADAHLRLFQDAGDFRDLSAFHLIHRQLKLAAKASKEAAYRRTAKALREEHFLSEFSQFKSAYLRLAAKTPKRTVRRRKTAVVKKPQAPRKTLAKRPAPPKPRVFLFNDGAVTTRARLAGATAVAQFLADNPHLKRGAARKTNSSSK